MPLKLQKTSMQRVLWIEANNIEYGNIEDRNIEFDVR